MVSQRWELLERARLDPARPLASGYRRLSAERVSHTDPDAALMTTAAGGRAALGYPSERAAKLAAFTSYQEALEPRAARRPA